MNKETARVLYRNTQQDIISLNNLIEEGQISKNANLGELLALLENLHEQAKDALQHEL